MHSRRMTITHEDVEGALARFRQAGRGITRLEPQATDRAPASGDTRIVFATTTPNENFFLERRPKMATP